MHFNHVFKCLPGILLLKIDSFKHYFSFHNHRSFVMTHICLWKESAIMTYTKDSWGTAGLLLPARA